MLGHFGPRAGGFRPFSAVSEAFRGGSARVGSLAPPVQAPCAMLRQPMLLGPSRGGMVVLWSQ